MFTTKHLDKVLGEIRGLHAKSIYSPKKNLTTYRLSRMSSQYRGAAIERMVRNYYRSKGKIVEYFGGTNPFDMRVNGRRIEVKSSLATASVVGGNLRYSYQFQNIKTENFDMLVLVYVSPEGFSVRCMSKQTAEKYLANSNYYSNGQTLYVGRTVKSLAGRVLTA